MAPGLDPSGGQLLCPLIEKMSDHGLNNNTQVNLMVVCVHGLVSCLGILENSLILWVVGFRLKQRTVTSVWVLNLAFSDFLATLTLPLFTVYMAQSHSWELGDPLCKAQSSLFFLNMFVSAFLLAAISLDRLLLVVRPVWCQNRRSVGGAWKVCALGWIWAALNAAPYAAFRSVITRRDGRKLCYHDFALFSSSEETLEWDCNLRQGATAISKLLLAFLFPLLVIAGCYVQIALRLRRRTLKRNQSTTKLADMQILSNLSDSDGESGKKKPSSSKPESCSPSFKLSNGGRESGKKKPSLCWRNQSTTRLADMQIVSNFSNGDEESGKKKPSQSCAPSFKLRAQSLTPSTSVPSPGNLLSPGFSRMVASVVAAFVLCWFPYHAFCLLELRAPSSDWTLRLVEAGLPLAATLAFFNPVLNPVLYVFCCPQLCRRIRRSLGNAFDGLLEEGGGAGGGGGGGAATLGRSLRSQIRRRCSRDTSFTTPGSPGGDLPSEGKKDSIQEAERSPNKIHPPMHPLSLPLIP